MRQHWFPTLAWFLLLLTSASNALGQSAPQPSNEMNPSKSEQQSPGDATAAHRDGTVTLPAGSAISVRIADEVNSNKNHPGDMFVGSVDPSVLVGDRVVIPRGTEAHVEMMDDKKGGKFHGNAEVELQLTSLIMNGERSDVDAYSVNKKKGALSTKAQAEVKPGAAGAAEVAASVNPVGAVALGGIAAFRAAKVDMKPGSRISFTLSGPFTFTPPPVPPPAPDDSDSDKSKKKKK